MKQEVAPIAALNDCRADPPIGSRLSLHANQWEATTSDRWVLSTVKSGLALEFLTTLSKMSRVQGRREERPDGHSQSTFAGHPGCSTCPSGPAGTGILFSLIRDPKELGVGWSGNRF